MTKLWHRGSLSWYDHGGFPNINPQHTNIVMHCMQGNIWTSCHMSAEVYVHIYILYECFKLSRFAKVLVDFPKSTSTLTSQSLLVASSSSDEHSNRLLMFIFNLCSKDINRCSCRIGIAQVSDAEGQDFDPRSSQTNDLQNWYLKLPILMSDINRIEHGFVSPVLL